MTIFQLAAGVIVIWGVVQAIKYKDIILPVILFICAPLAGFGVLWAVWSMIVHAH